MNLKNFWTINKNMQNEIKKILEVAVNAPSGENAQPWRFTVKDNQIFIFNISKRDQSLYNFSQKGSLVAHGTLIENIVIATSQNGYKADISLFPDLQEPNLTAVIKLVETNPTEERFYPFIKERATNRKPYENKKLNEGQKRSFLNAPEEVGGGGKIILVDEEDKKRALGEAASVNERVMFDNQFLHNFFFNHINWTEEEEKEKRIGFYIKTLELPPPARVLFKIIRYWPVMKIFNLLGFAKMAAKGNAKLYATAGAFGAIVVDGDSSRDFINAGRLMQRVWLKATKMGLGFHPVTGILFLARRVIAGETKELSETHIQLIKKSHETIKLAFGVENGVIAIVFRVGYAEKPSARSSKLPPDIEWE